MNKKRFSMAAGTVLLPLSTLCLVAIPNAASGKPIAIAEIKHDGMVDFQREVLPILQRNCLACHNAAEAESDLILETPKSILKGGAEGPAVVPGKGAESMLIKLASHQDEPFMPPPDNSVKANALAPKELGLIKLWIDQGAKGGAIVNEEIVFERLPIGVNPIYAVAISPDGQYVAAGRANQVFIYHLPSKREIGRLTDPELIKSGLYKDPGTAHLDLIQSLVFSPDSRTLASGGYRTVKLRDLTQQERFEPGRSRAPAPTLVTVEIKDIESMF
ncbi:MAG: hypothetical protein IH991_05360, partial [Planctomycetes bacterium]|nr:hypothetical protein [Planctomycetota bacterium]